METGKFVESVLRAKPDYAVRHRQWVEKNGHQKQELWNDLITRLVMESKGAIDVHEFKSLWYETFAELDLSWIMPCRTITASWKMVPGLSVRESANGATLQSTPPWRQKPAKRSRAPTPLATTSKASGSVPTQPKTRPVRPNDVKTFAD